jgi:hypothetical protein
MDDPCVASLRLRVEMFSLVSSTRSVLESLEEPLLRKGYHVVRYNSRGVGRSRGRSSFTGDAEAKDLEEVVAWAMSLLPNVSSVAIAVRRSIYCYVCPSLRSQCLGLFVWVADRFPFTRSSRASTDLPRPFILSARPTVMAHSIPWKEVRRCSCAVAPLAWCARVSGIWRP